MTGTSRPGGPQWPGNAEAPAWSGVAGHLAGCQEPPQPSGLYKAGQRAISRVSDRELREHGITRGSGGLKAMPGFDACYDQLAAARDYPVFQRQVAFRARALVSPEHTLAASRHGGRQRVPREDPLVQRGHELGRGDRVHAVSHSDD